MESSVGGLGLFSGEPPLDNNVQANPLGGTNAAFGQNGHYLDSDELNEMLHEAYGSGLVDSVDTLHKSDWYERWLRVVRLTGKQYNIPGSSIGRKYVESSAVEVQQIVSRNFCSERLIVFSAVMLQRDRSVLKGIDILEIIG